MDLNALAAMVGDHPNGGKLLELLEKKAALVAASEEVDSQINATDLKLAEAGASMLALDGTGNRFLDLALIRCGLSHEKLPDIAVAYQDLDERLRRAAVGQEVLVIARHLGINDARDIHPHSGLDLLVSARLYLARLTGSGLELKIVDGLSSLPVDGLAAINGYMCGFHKDIRVTEGPLSETSFPDRPVPDNNTGSMWIEIFNEQEKSVVDFGIRRITRLDTGYIGIGGEAGDPWTTILIGPEIEPWLASGRSSSAKEARQLIAAELPRMRHALPHH